MDGMLSDINNARVWRSHLRCIAAYGASLAGPTLRVCSQCAGSRQLFLYPQRRGANTLRSRLAAAPHADIKRRWLEEQWEEMWRVITSLSGTDE